MKKKKDDFYYKNLNACMDTAYEAAGLLHETVKDFRAGRLQEKLATMHELEQKGDSKRHKMMAVLSQAFITPIEREDLVALSSCLDDITDGVEDIMIKIYMSNVTEIRKDIVPMTGLLMESIETLGRVIAELRDFKHSKVIERGIIDVNDLEEKGDQLFVESMRRLYSEADVRNIVIWRHIYECIENGLDCCEHAADIVETVMMKNS